MELLHIDLFGTIDTVSINQKKYGLVIVDDIILPVAPPDVYGSRGKKRKQYEAEIKEEKENSHEIPLIRKKRKEQISSGEDFVDDDASLSEVFGKRRGKNPYACVLVDIPEKPYSPILIEPPQSATPYLMPDHHLPNLLHKMNHSSFLLLFKIMFHLTTHH